jgi:hypothetical protein
MSRRHAAKLNIQSKLFKPISCARSICSNRSAPAASGSPHMRQSEKARQHPLSLQTRSQDSLLIVRPNLLPRAARRLVYYSLTIEYHANYR